MEKEEPVNIFQFIIDWKNAGGDIVEVPKRYMEYLVMNWSNKWEKKRICDFYDKQIYEVKKATNS